MGKSKENFEEYVKKFNNYVVENSKPHYGEQEQLAVRVYNYIERAHNGGYELEVEDIRIKESEKTKNSYNFTVKIKYAKSGSKNSQTIDVSGLINTNEVGKVIRIKYYNSNKLIGAFKG